MELEIGNKVKFINENLEGEILKILPNDQVLVSCSDGFERMVCVTDLLIINSDNTHSYKVNNEEITSKINPKPIIKKESNGILSKYTEKNKYRLEGVLEIDLHLEELVEFPGKLDDWQKLHTQMQYAKKCLHAAMDKGIRKVVFIHGVGTGVLKIELRNYLLNYSNLTFNDADFREYGVGATEVIIKN